MIKHPEEIMFIECSQFKHYDINALSKKFYLFERKGKRKRESKSGQRERILHLLVHFPNGRNDQVCAKRNPRGKDFMFLFYKVLDGQALGSHWFPSALTGI